MLTLQFTASLSVLNPERNRPSVHLVYLLNDSVNKSPLIAENVSPVMLPTIPFVLNHGMLGDIDELETE